MEVPGGVARLCLVLFLINFSVVELSPFHREKDLDDETIDDLVEKLEDIVKKSEIKGSHAKRNDDPTEPYQSIEEEERELETLNENDKREDDWELYENAQKRHYNYHGNKEMRHLADAKFSLRDNSGESSENDTDDDNQKIEGDMTRKDVEKNKERGRDHIAVNGTIIANPNYNPNSGNVQHQGVDDETFVKQLLDGDTTVKRNFLNHFEAQNRHWPGGVLPYEIDGSVSSLTGIITTAMNGLTAQTCITFTPKTSSDRYWVTFTASGGCSSTIGRTPFIDQGQYIYLNPSGCGQFLSTVYHEIFHALGSIHEQSRLDRTKAITINWSNLGTDRSQYDLGNGIDSETDSFDHSSVMLYYPGGDYTLLDTDLAYLLRTGSSDLSYYDVKTITNTYECTVENSCPAITCQNAGFQTSDCTCRCPGGLQGSDCNTIVGVCGGVFDLQDVETMTISSPQYPSNYILGQTCTWMFRAPTGSRIKFNIQDLVTYKSGSDCEHYVNIKYNLIGQEGYKLCGDLGNPPVPREWTTNINEEYNLLMIQFVATNTGSRMKGFTGTVSSFKSGCSSDPCKHGGTCTDTTTAPFYTCVCRTGFALPDCYTVQAAGTVGCTFEKDYLGGCVVSSVTTNLLGWEIVSFSEEYTGSANVRFTAPEGETYARVNPSFYAGTSIIAELETNAVFEAAERRLTFSYVSWKSTGDRPPLQLYYEGDSVSETLLFEAPDNNVNWHTITLTVPSVTGLKVTWRAHYRNFDHVFLVDNIIFEPVSVDPCSPNPCQNSGSCVQLTTTTYRCDCTPDYTGDNCETLINPCDTNPCQNSGTCARDSATAYTCTCTADWTGTNCETFINLCDPNPCQNSGTCARDSATAYTCTCTADYTGTNCETFINPCDTNPCQNSGTCARDSATAYTCTCTADWTGTNCETFINLCDPNPCQNSGTCARDSATAYTCTCTADYTGTNCETFINPCDTNPCQNSGTCARDSATAYTCTCTADWTGTNCETFINLCDPNPCQNSGTCARDSATAYTCTCTADYTGTNCETFIDPCVPNPCQNSGTCARDSATAYTCTCTADWTGTNCDSAVNPVTPCDPDPCQNGGTCTIDSATTYTCTCTPDWTGTNCDTLINLCDPNPCQNSGACTRDSATAYTCTCTADWTGTNCETFINLCDPNPCQNSGACTRDSATAYTCTCTADWTGTNCETFINPCDTNPCQNSGTCARDSATAYTCTCTADWSGTNCETFINLCDPNPCQNSGTCARDSATAYTCTCTADYTGTNCETFINPCDTNPCQNSGTCARDSATAYTCTCTADWTGTNCETFINLCDPNPCQNSGTCARDSATAYTCTCTADYTGTNCETFIDPCVPNPCQNSGTCARDSATAYTCTCTADWTGTNCDSAVNPVTPCDPDPCQNGGTCTIDSATTYTCTCTPDWTGTNCDTLINLCDPNPCQNSGACTRDSATAYTCICTADWTGTNCETFINPCDTNPCQNSGTCARDSATAYTCICTADWTGTNCETFINLCDPNPCQNSGACTRDSATAYTCTCTADYTGTNCETFINPCDTNPCQNSGTCARDSATAYTCTCTADWTGTNCETFINLCDPNPCQNSGTCARDSATAYTCTCTADYTGTNCETFINPCDTNPCQNSGTCARDSATAYTCTCTADWTGTNCETFINLCDPNPCQNSGTCARDSATAYTCTCTADYTGTNCETFINPCDTNPCQNSGTCARDSATAYTCTCTADWTGTNCETFINLCDPNPCQNSGTCARDSATAYTCTCTADYTGTNCETFIDPCVPNPCQNSGTCASDSATAYTCTCTADWTGTNCDSAVNPVTPCDPDPCQNGGTCTIDSATTYTCTCTPDWTGTNCDTLINLCDPNPCQNSGACTRDSATAYTCTCTADWTGTNCETFINPCDTNPCQNSGTCARDSATAYTCTCTADWTGTNCETFINLCDPNPCQNSGACTRDSATAYTCTCTADYTGTNCETFINPCDTNPCQNSGTCARDSATAYTCTCTADWTGTNCETFINLCDPNPCQNSGTCARDSAMAYTCTCTADYTGTNCETFINLCDPNPCQNSGTCARDSATAYTCTCTADYTGTNCETFINPCDTNPCQNSGTCARDSATAYTCTCTADWTGTNCETFINLCDPNPCQNSGACTRDSATAYTCTCTADWTGTNCETFINPCDTNPCQNSGTCARDSATAYTCTCTADWTGTNCETFINLCDPNPCQNSGTCARDSAMAYTCTCTADYTGTNCETFINLCDQNPCQNSGTCARDSATAYTCTCTADYTGTNCETFIDPCDSDPCLNDGTCARDSATMFTCTCAAGWTGTDCNTLISNTACDATPCQNGGTCVPDGSSFTCSCTDDYAGDTCQYRQFRESFEQGGGSFLVNAANNDRDWQNNQGCTPTTQTGPCTANSGNGYSYFEASNINTGDVGRLETDVTLDAPNYCLCFAYHMYGRNMGDLSVLSTTSGQTTPTTVWEDRGERGDKWLNDCADVAGGSGLKIIFEATRGDDNRGDIAIDDVELTPGFCGCKSDPCYGSATCSDAADGSVSCTCPSGFTGQFCELPVDAVVQCTFEGNDDTCPFQPDPFENFVFNWIFFSGSTPSIGTGPLSASEGVYFLFIEASGRLQGARARLSTNVFTELISAPTRKRSASSSDRCMAIDYNMHINEGVLRVIQKLSDGTENILWSEDDDSGPVWHTAVINIPYNANSQIIIEAERGDTYQSDIAIDNIRVHPGCCPCETAGICQNGGTCFNVDATQYHCACTSDWEGTNCETRKPGPCDSSPCNEGHCEGHDDGSYSCECPLDRTGANCENAVASGVSLTRCSFERGENRFCEFVNDDSIDDMDWRLQVRNRGTASSDTGPSGAFEGSRYIYLEASHPAQPDDIAVLILNEIPPVDESCLRFAYSMYGSGMGSLSVDAGLDPLWSRSGDQQQGWHEAFLSIPGNSSVISLVGKRGVDYKSDIALDNVEIISGSCECASSPCQNGGTCVGSDGSYTCTCPSHTTGSNCEFAVAQPFVCNFEVPDDQDPGCLLRETTGDDFDWTLNMGSTNSLQTGPNQAFQGACYKYIEASPQSIGEYADLSTPYLIDQDGGPMCLIFHYHMYVRRFRTTLEVISDGPNGRVVEFVRSSFRGREWQQGVVQFNDVNATMITFRGTVGHNYKADVALDRIRLEEGYCRDILNHCGFESEEETCPFHNLKGPDDAFDFTISHLVPNPSPTSGTGPSAAQEGSSYAYIEASSRNGRRAGRHAVLSTIGIPYNNVDMCLSLYYHMKGANIGSLIIYSGDRTGTHAIQREVSGEASPADNWHELFVDIPADPDLVIDIVAETVGGVLGDISIDNVRVQEGGCT